MIEYRGWSLPASFGDPSSECECVAQGVGLCDVSWMVRLDLKGSGVKSVLAFAEAQTWTLGRGHVLITCDADARAAVLASLEGLAPPVYVTDVTSVYAQFLLAGQRVRDVLRKLTALDVSDRKLPDLACAQTSLAHVHTLVLRQDLRSIPAFQLLVTRDYAESVWESVLHAGREFNIAPFGADALARLHAGTA
jgi:heterotetrameric sarcosine oxidase gamma subunit